MRRMWSAALGVATGLGALTMAGMAHGATNEPIAQTGGAEISLVGIPLNVSVELNPDTGDITAVNVTDGSGAAAAVTATKVTPTKVRFASNDDGSTKVSVSAKNNKLSFGVHTSSLAKLVGANTWKADLFGTGAKTTVPYTIGDSGGAPTFAFGTPTGLPADVKATDLGTWDGGRHDDDDEDMSAGGRMSFERNGFRKVLTIWVTVGSHDGDDNSAEASLRITLSGNNVQRKSLTDLVGAKTWAGQLCDGKTKASIAYTVAADGTLKVDSTTPADATVENGKNGFTVRFVTGDKVSIRLVTKEDGQAALGVSVRGRNCTTPASISPPKVNVPVATTAAKTDQSGKDSHKGSGDRKNGGSENRGGGHDG